jgi:homogentisate 1,2-dioxygenase
MYSKVKILRTNGVRRSDREIAADAWHEGAVTMHQAGTGCQLQLSSVDGSVQTSVIPVLYDARLVTMHSNKMLFHGIQRAGERDDAQYFQEWSVMVLNA